MLKIFSLIEFGERAGSGLSGICKRWEKVYHTPVTIEETHKDGVDRTVLTLSTGGNEKDVKAMLELYSDLIDTPEPQTDQETTQKTNNTTQMVPKSDQKADITTQKISDTTQKIDTTTQKTTQKKEQATTQKVDLNSKSTSEKIVLELKKNPSLSRKQLAQLIPTITEDGIKYHLSKLQEKGIIRRIGPDRGGHWIILGQN